MQQSTHFSSKGDKHVANTPAVCMTRYALILQAIVGASPSSALQNNFIQRFQGVSVRSAQSKAGASDGSACGSYHVARHLNMIGAVMPPAS